MHDRVQCFFYCTATAILFDLRRSNCIVLMIVSMKCERFSDNRFMVLYVVSVVGL